MSQKFKRFKPGEHVTRVATVVGGTAVLAGIVITAKAGLPVSKLNDGKKVFETAAKMGSEAAREVAKAGSEVAKDAATNVPRYQVQMKALKTGEWYTKTLTNSKPAAFSVATTCAGPRASRVIDTLENVVKNVNLGDAASYAKYLK